MQLSHTKELGQVLTCLPRLSNPRRGRVEIFLDPAKQILKIFPELKG